jgi:hypothetical protein
VLEDVAGDDAKQQDHHVGHDEPGGDALGEPGRMDASIGPHQAGFPGRRVTAIARIATGSSVR